MEWRMRPLKNVDIPQSLDKLGVKEEDIPNLAKDAYADVCTGGNPRDTSVEEIEGLYKSMLHDPVVKA
ncbi:MAG: iron-containing alcohol dehydrogenase [Heyndrickxia faecalis]|jgi:alcohol dehydrogenase class IV|uniref:Iron-containing alcohol dehydrogenase n=3 Tax=Heyndrickxia TaxID=2837504 RepID=G2TJT5_HEYCO|nr:MULTISPECIES: iron-containing alcohol dehydrogenase [Heyndrickxia]NWN95504.1 iron-containing alcohol dehydrogenase [Bacillus sp. (in: firmicutes)]AEO99356.1 iron-containing alcohol dehydrogenase [Heyndrickxia coagulans 36D1]AWP36657.1 alcohol dehydrogenase [Heyndrickxia coagulans]KGT38949.1 alcohol dehydrogenase [Heyndrickxia coagulans P38]KWZ86490.1 hypothetical protein HMPREF3213_00015 [Heyndrickxia coagulans]